MKMLSHYNYLHNGNSYIGKVISLHLCHQHAVSVQPRDVGYTEYQKTVNRRSREVSCRIFEWNSLQNKNDFHGKLIRHELFFL